MFVDTSAILAVLDLADNQHGEASRQWRDLITNEIPMVSTNYVLVETLALLQHRFGVDAVRTFIDDVAPLLTIEWVTAELHAVGLSAMAAAARRNLSFVDCVSFEVMRQRRLTTAFAFDRHFEEQGFRGIAM